MLNMQQGKIHNVWHLIKNGQACEKSENTTKRKGGGGEGNRPRNDTNNTIIICTKGYCNYMPCSQEGRGQEVERRLSMLSRGTEDIKRGRK